MIHSFVRSLRLSRVLALLVVSGLGCTVKGIQSPHHDGGADARDGGKGDVRGIDATAGRSGGGSSGSAGAGAGGFSTTFLGGGGTSYFTYVGGTTSWGGWGGGGTTSIGGSSSNNTTRPIDAGLIDTKGPDARDAAGGTGGSSSKVDAFIPDANKVDTRDAPLGGTGGSSSSGGTGGSSDARLPDAPLPDTRLPDTAFDTPAGNTDVGTPLRIYAFNVATETGTPSTQLTVSAGQIVTFSWAVTGATTMSINQDVGPVTGTSKTITVPSPETETTYTYKLSITNATDASSTYEGEAASVKITVVPLALTSFSANETAINLGDSITLTAVYRGSEASITNNVNDTVIHPVSGEGITVVPPSAITYTLTVKNRLNSSHSAEVSITMPRPVAAPVH